MFPTPAKGVTLRHLCQCRNWIVVSQDMLCCVAVNWMHCLPGLRREKSIRCSPQSSLTKKNVPFFLEMYVPEPTNIPIEKTNHREIDMEVPLWPTPSENDIIHLPRGKCQSQQITSLFHCRCSVNAQWELGSSSLTTFHFSQICHVYDLLFF